VQDDTLAGTRHPMDDGPMIANKRTGRARPRDRATANAAIQYIDQIFLFVQDELQAFKGNVNLRQALDGHDAIILHNNIVFEISSAKRNQEARNEKETRASAVHV
jgi:hypothetical protein